MFDRWQTLQPELHLYQFNPISLPNVKLCPPILMIHSFLSGPRSWEPMSEFFQEYGLEKLYALQIPDLQLGKLPQDSFQQIQKSIQFILRERHPKDQAVIVIGHGVGGLLAYRYWQAHADMSQIAYLFMIGVPHDSTSFSLITRREHGQYWGATECSQRARHPD